jgi:hypothetical protein
MRLKPLVGIGRKFIISVVAAPLAGFSVAGIRPDASSERFMRRGPAKQNLSRPLYKFWRLRYSCLLPHQSGGVEIPRKKWPEARFADLSRAWPLSIKTASEVGSACRAGLGPARQARPTTRDGSLTIWFVVIGILNERWRRACRKQARRWSSPRLLARTALGPSRKARIGSGAENDKKTLPRSWCRRACRR